MRRGLRWGDLIRLLGSWAVATVALMIASDLLGDIEVTSNWAYVAVAGVTGLVGLVLRPVLVEVSARVGWLAVLLVALTAQALVMYVAIQVVPGMTATFWAAFWRQLGRSRGRHPDRLRHDGRHRRRVDDRPRSPRATRAVDRGPRRRRA